NMPKAGRIAASRATRSARRPLPASPPNAMPAQLAMMSVGGGKTDVSAISGSHYSFVLVGTNDLQPTALAGVDHETKAMQLDDRGYQVQAKAHPRRTPD